MNMESSQGKKLRQTQNYREVPASNVNLAEQIPLENMMRPPLPPPHNHPHPNRVVGGGNLTLYWVPDEDPVLEQPPRISSSPRIPRLPPQSHCALDVDDIDDNNNNKSVGNDRGTQKISRCSTFYLFYATIVQSSLKSILCVAIMSMDVRLDNACRSVDCHTPVYTHDRAIYFMVSLAIFGLSAVHCCVGIFLFTKQSTLMNCFVCQRLSYQALQPPMSWYALALAIELFVVTLSAALVNVTMEMMGVVLGAMLIEISAVLIVFCYPKSAYEELEEETDRVGNR